MKTSVLIIVIGVVVTFLGVLHVENTQQMRTAWSVYEANLTEKTELNVEWNKLKLEESMLITGVLLDQDVRDRLGMVVPDINAVVYVVEQSTPKQIVSVANNQGNVVQ